MIGNPTLCIVTLLFYFFVVFLHSIIVPNNLMNGKIINTGIKEPFPIQAMEYQHLGLLRCSWSLDKMACTSFLGRVDYLAWATLPINYLKNNVPRHSENATVESLRPALESISCSNHLETTKNHGCKIPMVKPSKKQNMGWASVVVSTAESG